MEPDYDPIMRYISDVIAAVRALPRVVVLMQERSTGKFVKRSYLVEKS